MQYKSVPNVKQNATNTPLNYGILMLDPNNNFFEILCDSTTGVPLQFNTLSEADAYIGSNLSAVALDMILDIYDTAGMAPGFAAIFAQVPKANMQLAFNIETDPQRKAALGIMIANYDAAQLFYSNIEQANVDFAP